MKGKRFLAIILSATMLLGTCLTAHAEEDNECLVDIEVTKSFEVTVPKKITLDGTTKMANYSINVKGDIGGLDIIDVYPSNDGIFTMSQSGKEDVEATINQLQTTFNYMDVSAKNESNEIIGTTVEGNTVTAEGLTSGTWNGNFYFNIDFESVASNFIEINAKNITQFVNCTIEQVSDNEFVIHFNDNDVVIPYEVTLENGRTRYVRAVNFSNAFYEPYPIGWTYYNFDTSNVNSISLDEGIEKITVNGEACDLVNKLAIPSTITRLDSMDLSVCGDTLYIPDGIQTIGYNALYGANVANVIIPNSVTKIEELAFTNWGTGYNGVRETNITLSDNIQELNNGSFDIHNIASITYKGVEYKSGNNFLLHSKNLIECNGDVFASNVNGALYSEYGTGYLYKVEETLYKDSATNKLSDYSWYEADRKGNEQLHYYRKYTNYKINRTSESTTSYVNLIYSNRADDMKNTHSVENFDGYIAKAIYYELEELVYRVENGLGGYIEQERGAYNGSSYAYYRIAPDDYCNLLMENIPSNLRPDSFEFYIVGF